MTHLLHRFDSERDFEQRRQLAELDYLVNSRAAMMSLAENYAGLAMEWGEFDRRNYWPQMNANERK